MSANRYLTRLGETLTTLHGTPGRRVQTLADASLMSWIKHYRPDENSPNSAISYYLKGEVVCALLDLELRRATGDAQGLDDVVRLLWQRYGSRLRRAGARRGGAGERGGRQGSARPSSIARCAPPRSWTTPSSRTWAWRWASACVSPPATRAARLRRARPATRSPRAGWASPSRATPRWPLVQDGSPAMEAGLYPEDEVVALDGYKMDGSGAAEPVRGPASGRDGARDAVPPRQADGAARGAGPEARGRRCISPAWTSPPTRRRPPSRPGWVPPGTRRSARPFADFLTVRVAAGAHRHHLGAMSRLRILSVLLGLAALPACDNRPVVDEARDAVLGGAGDRCRWRW